MRSRGLVLAGLLAVALAAGAVAWWYGTRDGEAARTVQIGGAFSLVDQDGKPVTDATYRGKWLLVYFGYTHCPDACPTALGTIAVALDELGAKRSRVQALFVSIDPERDTPEVMKSYVASFEGDVTGLTGTPEQVARAAKAYRVYYAKNARADGDYDMDHSSVIFVIGPDGRYAGHFTHVDPPEKIAERLAGLIS